MNKSIMKKNDRAAKHISFSKVINGVLNAFILGLIILIIGVIVKLCLLTIAFFEAVGEPDTKDKVTIFMCVMVLFIAFIAYRPSDDSDEE